MADLQGEAKARYVAQLFARIARRYDLVNTAMSAGAHHRWRRLTAAMTTEGVEGTALDVATGTGDLGFSVAKRLGIKAVVGIDFVPEMVAVARRKAERRRLSGRVSFLQGDALALPFADATFACAVCGLGLRNFTDVPAAVAEMARVVRPGGRVGIMEITPIEGKGPLPRLTHLYFHRVVPLIGALLTGDHAAYTYLPRSVDSFPLSSEIARLMADVGLEAVRYRKVAMGSVTILVGQKPTKRP